MKLSVIRICNGSIAGIDLFGAKPDSRRDATLLMQWLEQRFGHSKSNAFFLLVATLLVQRIRSRLKHFDRFRMFKS